jgi:hypothetical protein
MKGVRHQWSLRNQQRGRGWPNLDSTGYSPHSTLRLRPELRLMDQPTKQRWSERVKKCLALSADDSLG